MEREFAILHNTGKGQILVIREYLPETEEYKLSIKFTLKEVSVGQFEFNIKSEEDCNEAFEDFRDVNKVLKTLKNKLNKMGIKF